MRYFSVVLYEMSHFTSKVRVLPQKTYFRNAKELIIFEVQKNF